MKRNLLILIMLSFCLYNCNGQNKTKSEIVYFLPASVKQKITEKLKTLKETIGISFTLGNDESGNYVIYLNLCSEKEYKFWITNTNRSVFINNKFYPLVLKTDEIFSYPENKELIFKKIENKEYIRKSIIIRDNVFHVKFKTDGEIVN